MGISFKEYCIGNGLPDLLAQWDAEANLPLTPETVPWSVHRKIHWLCEKGHAWTAYTYDRIKGTGLCPVCAGKRIVPGINDLQSQYPELTRQWHPTKNQGLDPAQMFYRSNRSVWWRCKKGHEWQASIHSRAQGADCPVCCGKKIVAGINDFATLYPRVAREWDHEKNGVLKPTEIGGASNRHVWWKCPQGHSYKAVVASRTSGESGCPYCGGKRVLAGFNDLATVDPAVAAQWHPTLNGPLTPEMVTKGSNKRVWWICGDGHVWKAPVYSRTGKRRHGCPYCNGRYRKDPTPLVREAVSAEMWIDKQALPDADPFHITTESHTGEEATAMRTIIVDNDQAELRRFSQLSQGVRDIQIVGQFESDLEALMYVRENPVELAFLNISVSSAGGITLAKELRKIREGMLIVFASESGKWINDANKIGGDYYLIKPYSRGALEMAKDRVRLIAQRLKRTLTIQTFGEFTVLKEGKPISLAGKAKEILALLVSRRRQEISNRELYAILWPGREYRNHNMSVLYNALNRLRNSLRKEDAENLLITTAHGHMINTELFDCDYYMWEDAAPGEREEFEATFLSQYMWARNVLENKKEPYGLAVAAQGR